jgi:hypothetical protein
MAAIEPARTQGLVLNLLRKCVPISPEDGAHIVLREALDLTPRERSRMPRVVGITGTMRVTGVVRMAGMMGPRVRMPVARARAARQLVGSDGRVDRLGIPFGVTDLVGGHDSVHFRASVVFVHHLHFDIRRGRHSIVSGQGETPSGTESQ